MQKPLGVHPGNLYATSAGLTGAQTSTGAAIVAVSPSVVPIPAGVDDVSLFSATAFGSYSALLFSSIGSGLAKGADGVASLSEAGLSLQTSDSERGATIATAGAEFTL